MTTKRETVRTYNGVYLYYINLSLCIFFFFTCCFWLRESSIKENDVKKEKHEIVCTCVWVNTLGGLHGFFFFKRKIFPSVNPYVHPCFTCLEEISRSFSERCTSILVFITKRLIFFFLQLKFSMGLPSSIFDVN